MAVETRDRTRTNPDAGGNGHEQRLDSWKEIAGFFSRDIRTVQLWEKREHLPVHRHEHGSRSSVYAWPEELQEWREQRKPNKAPAPVSTVRSERKLGRRWILAGAVLLILAVAAVVGGRFWYLRYKMVRMITTHTLAVLPFENFTSDPNQDYLSDGITDELTTVMASIPGLQVVARTSAFQFRHKAADVREIGQQLNAAALLEGSLSRNGDQLRVNVQLIRTGDGYHIWSQIYECSFRDVGTVEDQIAGSVAEHMGLGSSTSGMALASNQPVPDAQAHEMYLRGRYWWERTMGADQWKAVNEFSQAIARDPLYARAWLGLADAYAVLAIDEQAPPEDLIPKARAAAEKALELDPNLGEAHATLAHIRFFYDWDDRGAEEEFRKSIQLDPNDATARHWYGLMLLYTARFDDAERETRRAEELDPLSPVLPAVLSRIYLFSGNADEAIRILRAAIPHDPKYAVTHDALGQAYREKAEYGQALEEFNQYVRVTNGDPDAWMNLAQTYAQMGDRAKALEIMERMQKPGSGYVSPFNFALVYAAIGDKAQMYAWLDRAIQVRAAACLTLKVDPAFRPWRSEPRFQELLRKTGQQ